MLRLSKSRTGTAHEPVSTGPNIAEIDNGRLKSHTLRHNRRYSQFRIVTLDWQRNVCGHATRRFSALRKAVVHDEPTKFSVPSIIFSYLLNLSRQASYVYMEGRAIEDTVLFGE